MKKRRIKSKNSKIIIVGFCFCLFFMGIGYATLQTTLNFQVKGNKNRTFSFRDDSWDTIAQNIKDGYAEEYKVGDAKEIQVGSLGIFKVRVANTTTPSECSTSGYSESACGFVVEFEDVVTTHNMNSTNTNVGGYPAMEMKTYLSKDFFEMLPLDLQKNIKTTAVVSSHGSKDTSNFTSSEKVYLLSTKEVWGETFVNSNDSAKDTTRQLDYYQTNGVTIDRYSKAMKKNLTGNGSDWWIRSASSTSSRNFYSVTLEGDWGSNSANEVFGVSPAFRIG